MGYGFLKTIVRSFIESKYGMKIIPRRDQIFVPSPLMLSFLTKRYIHELLWTGNKICL